MATGPVGGTTGTAGATTTAGVPLLNVAETAYGTAYGNLAAELQTMAQSLATSAEQAKKDQAVLDLLASWPESGLTTPATPQADFDRYAALKSAIEASGIPYPPLNITLASDTTIPAGSPYTAYDPTRDPAGLAGVRAQWQQRINQIGQGSQQQQAVLQIKSDMLKFIADQWTNVRKILGDGFKDIVRSMN